MGETLQEQGVWFGRLARRDRPDGHEAEQSVNGMSWKELLEILNMDQRPEGVPSVSKASALTTCHSNLLTREAGPEAG